MHDKVNRLVALYVHLHRSDSQSDKIVLAPVLRHTTILLNQD